MRGRAVADDVPEARRRRAARLLLARPLLVAGLTDAETYRLVRAYAAELREWFDRETGWQVVADAHTVRLVKLTADPHDGTHPARDPRSRTPFSRQRYVLTCLALAALERADGQITLGRLAEEVLTGAAEPALAAAGFSFALDRRERRADMVAVVRLLLHWGVLRRVAGDEEAYLGAGGDVLYDVDPARDRRPARCVPGAVDDRRVDRAGPARGVDGGGRTGCGRRPEPGAAAPADPAAAGAAGGLPRRALRGRARLPDQPAARAADPDHPVHRLGAEVRAEGIAMVDPEDELTDVRMPAEGMQSHLTLLLAEHIAAGDGGVRVSELQRRTRELAVEHRSYWRKHATDPGAEVDLVATALEALRALKLIRVEPGADPLVLPRPAIARYALAAPTIREPAARPVGTDKSERSRETAR